MQKKLIVVGGATASGKTKLAIDLAQYFNTEIVSADSRQFYREMNIGTAKPTSEELKQAPHHFINNLSVHDNYSVGDFEKEALRVLDNIFEKNDTAILVGGTGLYIKAVCEGLDTFPDTPLSIRQKIEDLYTENGLEFIQNRLKEVDNQYFNTIDIQNPARIIRALSVYEASGLPYTHFLEKEKTPRIFTPVYICTDLPRLVLYDRINKRVDKMIAEGLEAEARNLYVFRQNQALQTVGYAEFFDYFEEKCPFDTAVEAIKQHSRNYAKRQTTWFRKSPPEWQRFDPSDTEGVIQFVKNYSNL